MRHWRWAVVIGGVAALISIPVVSARWPVDEPDITAAELQQRVLSSDSSAYSGMFESRGGLRIPDLGRFEDEVTPFKTTSRVRVWYAAPDRWRADELLIGAERGTYREPDVLWLWDSGTRRIVRSPRASTEPLRIPRLMDLSPPELGRRLLASAIGETITSRPAKRVAGQVAAGLRITPISPAATIEHVDLWADPDTGVVLRVEINTGETAAAFESAFVEVSFGSPDPDVVQFDPDEAAAPMRQSPTVDVIEALGQAPFLPLPDELAGLPRRGEDTGALATYGTGLSVVTLAVVPQGALGRSGRGVYALPSSDRAWGGQAIVVETELFNAELVRLGAIDVVLAGTVSVAELDRIAGEVVARGGFL
ncbi:MAG: outer membrane lipoprotein carrier protein LolA [Ilumatobacteraceae bacterium]